MQDWLSNPVITFFLGIVATFALGRLCGKQARYIGLLVFTPSHWRHIVHGFWPCPSCEGSGIERITGGIEAHPRMECLAESMQRAAAPHGYISTDYLLHGWDWWHWLRQPLYYVNRGHKKRRAKSA